MSTVRSEEILRLLKQHQKMSVKELSGMLYVCEMTIRRDLKELENSGFIKRYNGGAMLLSSERDYPFLERKLLYSKEKIKLAKETAKYAQKHDDIY